MSWLAVGVALPAIWVVGTNWTGVVLANAGVDRSLHDTYYVVSHPSYALLGAMLCAVWAMVYYAVPRFTGRATGSTAFGLHFVLTLAGLIPLIWPEVALGFYPMPRRYIDFPEAVSDFNRVALAGYFLIAGGGAICAAGFFLSKERTT